MSDEITGHCGGFIDGQRVIEVGFVTESGRLVTIPRDVLDRAVNWIRAQEGDDFEARTSRIEVRQHEHGGNTQRIDDGEGERG